MDKYEKLNRLSQGINTINQVLGIYKSNNPLSRDRNVSVHENSMETLRKMLSAVTENFPDNRMQKAIFYIDRTRDLSNTYKSLTNHIQSMRNTRNKGDYFRILEIVSPIISGKNRQSVDKMLRIYDIIKS